MITVNAVRDIDGTKQWVFITLTVDGDECRYTTVQPWNTNTPVLSGQDLEDFCNVNEDRYQVEILKGMYPGAIYQDSVGDTDLEKFTQWIADGHTNPSGVVDKVPFAASWSINVVTATQDMESSVFFNKTKAELITYIDNNWTNLTDSKAAFKKLVEEVRNIVLRQGWED